MVNFIALVLVMGLVNVHESSLIEKVLENDHGHGNEENDVGKVSTDIVKLTGDSNTLANQDNIYAIRSIQTSDGLDSKDTIGNDIGHDPVSGRLRSLITIFADPLDLGIFPGLGNVLHSQDAVDTSLDVPDLVSHVEDLTNLLADIRKELKVFLTEVPDLTPSVHCQDYKCKICIAVLCLIIGYDPDNNGLSLLIDFDGFTVLNENISTNGYSLCEHVKLPVDDPKICIIVSEMKITTEEVCLNVGFSIFSYSHTFHNLCM